MSDKKQIVMKRDTFVGGGKIARVGDTVELPEKVADRLCAIGKAIEVKKDNAEAVKELQAEGKARLAAEKKTA